MSLVKFVNSPGFKKWTPWVALGIVLVLGAVTLLFSSHPHDPPPAHWDPEYSGGK